MNNKKYHTVGTIPISNINILDKGIIDTRCTQIHDRSHSWLGTYTSIQSPFTKTDVTSSI